MRHGKSSWSSGAATDHARPLAARGARSARALCHGLVERGWRPDLVLASDARRALETFEEMRGALGEVQLVRVPELYLGGPYEVSRALRGLGPEVQTVLVLGHNPGLEACVRSLSGVEVRLRTADAVLLCAEGRETAGWEDLAGAGRFTLIDHVVARSLLGSGAPGKDAELEPPRA